MTGYKIGFSLVVFMLSTAVDISLPYIRESDATGKISEGKPDNNWGFSLAKEMWKDYFQTFPLPQLFFGQFLYYTDIKSKFFSLFFLFTYPST